MNRPLLLIASRHRATGSAITRLLDLFVPRSELPHEVRFLPFTIAEELFEQLDAIDPERLLDTMMILDVAAEDRNPWHIWGESRESGLVAQIVLSYPEVYFAFANAPLPPLMNDRGGGAVKHDLSTAFSHHFLGVTNLHQFRDRLRIHARGFRPAFDPTGLRSYLKWWMTGRSEVIRARVFIELSESRLVSLAAVADEEPPFLYLNGYAAYKAGFATWLVASESEFNRVIGPAAVPEKPGGAGRGRPAVAGPGTLDLLISDWDLVYPDHEGQPVPGSLLLRNELPLKATGQLILVSSFRDPEQNGAKLSPWRPFRTAKPYGGFFELLEQSASDGRNILRERYDASWNSIQKPDAITGESTPSEPIAGATHSAPFAFSSIAGRLLDRAKRIVSDDPIRAESWIQVALLAGEAKELLGGLSRTTSFEAIALQEEAEAMAEISFFGISAAVSAKRRLQSIEAQMTSVQNAASAGTKTETADIGARLNGLLRAVNALRRRYSENEQVAASEQCLVAFAEHQRHLDWITLKSDLITYSASNAAVPQETDLSGPNTIPNSKKSTFLDLINWCAVWYMDKVTRAGTSVGTLVAASGAWIVAFGVFYSLIHYFKTEDQSFEFLFANPLLHSMLTFVELQAGMSDFDHIGSTGDGAEPKTLGGLYQTGILCEVLIAYLHLGLLISLLYRRLTKRAP